jgi:hypothetical protein
MTIKLHLRPANLCPTGRISATNADVMAYSFGNLSAVFGDDLPAREAAANAYLERHARLSVRIRRALHSL